MPKKCNTYAQAEEKSPLQPTSPDRQDPTLDLSMLLQINMTPTNNTLMCQLDVIESDN